MAIDVTAFIKIEEALSKRLMKTWKSLALDFSISIKKAINDKDWKRAKNLTYGLKVDAVFDKNEDYIKYSTVAALVFGATRLRDDVDLVAKDYQEELDGAINILRKTIEKNMKELAIDTLLATIDELEAKANEVGTFSLIKAERKRLAQEFVSFKKSGDDMLQLISGLNTSRVSAFGYTAEAEILGVTEYRINEQLDSRICPVCAEMHGKTFSVSSARSSLTTILQAREPDDLKNLQPWLSQSKDSVAQLKSLTSEQLIARNLHIPPYHPSCRGLLYPANKVVPLPQEAVDIELPMNDIGWEGWARIVSVQEKEHVLKYSATWFSKVNDALRENELGTANDMVKKIVTSLTNVFIKAPKLDERAQVYRGLQSSEKMEEILNSLEEGDLWQDSGFVSTSTKSYVAFRDFADSAGFKVTINLPKGSKVLDLRASNLTESVDEYEVLLNRNSKFKVINIVRTSAGKVAEIELEGI